MLLSAALVEWAAAARRSKGRRVVLGEAVLVGQRAMARPVLSALRRHRARAAVQLHAAVHSHAFARRRLVALCRRWRQHAADAALLRMVEQAADRRARDVAVSAWHEAARAQRTLWSHRRAAGEARRRRALGQALLRWREKGAFLGLNARRARLRRAARAARGEAAGGLSTALPARAPVAQAPPAAALFVASGRARTRVAFLRGWRRWVRAVPRCWPRYARRLARELKVRVRLKAWLRALRRWWQHAARLRIWSAGLATAAAHSRHARWREWCRRMEERAGRLLLGQRASPHGAWLRRWLEVATWHAALAISAAERRARVRRHLLRSALARARAHACASAAAAERSGAAEACSVRRDGRRVLVRWRAAVGCRRSLEQCYQKGSGVAALCARRERSFLRRVFGRWRGRAVLQLLTLLVGRERRSPERSLFGRWRRFAGVRQYARALDTIGEAAAQHVSARSALRRLRRNAARRRLLAARRSAVQHEIQALWSRHHSALEAAGGY